MFWIGKIIGALLGYASWGWFGAVIGLLLGHWFDTGLARTRYGLGDLKRVHEVFFRTTFRVMGHVCKVDGQVTEAEIAAAESVMRQMNLPPERRRAAIEHFQAGKAADFDLDAALDEFRSVCRGHLYLVRMFLETQIQAALADGHVAEGERRVLLHIARRLGLSESDYQRLEAFLTGSYQRTHAGPTREDGLRAAYRELGVTPDASDTEVKRAYRKLMSEHHPDKQVAKGLPEEMVKLAHERTQEIQAAYEMVKESRGMK
jgi:DnaJ like chaperone protein